MWCKTTIESIYIQVFFVDFYMEVNLTNIGNKTVKGPFQLLSLHVIMSLCFVLVSLAAMIVQMKPKQSLKKS